MQSADLFGAWELQSVRTTDKNDVPLEVSHFGRKPEGLVIYDRAGWVSVQIQLDVQITANDGAAAAQTPGLDAAIASQRANYSAYCGTWTFDTKAQIVAHHIRWATYPRKRGDVLQRHVSLLDDVLTLVTLRLPESEGVRNHLTWRRLHGART